MNKTILLVKKSTKNISKVMFLLTFKNLMKTSFLSVN